MGRYLPFLLAFVLFGSPFVVEAQLMKRLQRAAEQGVSRAVERRVEAEVEKATQRQLEKAFGDLYGPNARGSSGGGYDFSRIMKSVNMDVDVEDAYHFTGMTEMELTGTDEKGKSIDPVWFKSFYNEGNEYSGMEFYQEGKKSQTEKTIMIFDVKNNASVILIENEKEKSSMAFSLDWNEIAEMADENDGQSEDYDFGDVKFSKTGNTKNIKGYTCEEYVFENEEYKGNYWVTKEPIGDFNNLWGKNSPFITQRLKTKNADYFNSLPDGNVLEINHESKVDKSTFHIQLVELDPKANSSFVMADYPNMMKAAD